MQDPHNLLIEEPHQQRDPAEQIAGTPRAPELPPRDGHEFVLRVIQPGLAGLLDGSVSTLAPIFAVAYATHRPFTE